MRRSKWPPPPAASSSSAGRLDIDSIGLLVLTQDGRVARQLIGEDSDIDKEYLVRVAYGDNAQTGHTSEMEQIESGNYPITQNVQAVFPPALLGRIVTIPYFPLSAEVLGSIVRLKLNSLVSRVKQNHKAKMTYSDAVVAHIVDQCRDPDSGGRMVDNIMTNTLLPELSRAVLTRTLDGSELTHVNIGMGENGQFTYDLG